MSVSEQVTAIAAMQPKALREEWARLRREPPPASFGPDLLARSLAYAVQEKVGGGLPSTVEREIRRGVAELAAGLVSPNRAPRLRPGTWLTREWHGQTHHVHVVEGGFDYRDRRYRSLTAIARQITGAGWSGPRFFGLAGRGGA